MTLSELEVRKAVAEFKATAISDLYTSKDLIDFNVVLSGLQAWSPELLAVQQLIDSGEMAPETLGLLLMQYPRAYAVLCSFLALPSGVELEGGRRLLPAVTPPKDLDAAKDAAEILLELGLGLLLRAPADVQSLFMLTQITADAGKRRFRLDARIKTKIEKLVQDAVMEVASETGISISVAAKDVLPTAARGVADYAIVVNDRPSFAVAVTFQGYSGGRQSRDFSSLYPSINQTLRNHEMSLILIADGPGVRMLSERVLRDLFRSQPQTFTITQAESGGLKKALIQGIQEPRPIGHDEAGITRLITKALLEGSGTNSASLPLPAEQARMALATFAAKNTSLSLNLSTDASSLSWSEATTVQRFRAARKNSNAIEVIDDLVNLLRANVVRDASENGIKARLASMIDDTVFTGTFLIAASNLKPTVDTLRVIARHSLQQAPDSRIALLLMPEAVNGPALQQLRDAQAFLPVTVVIVDLNACVDMATSSDPPRDRLNTLLLEQTDLTKLSPFVVRGVAPSRVFYGREQEEATLLSTLSTNSVALLGGRRIGKTSLMQHSFGRLKAANMRPFFGDCQVVRTWQDFGHLAHREWGFRPTDNFRPQDLFELVASLANGHDSPLIFLLDEVDQLLDWDKSHSDDEVPEAFFRACRSISQQGRAQFVFSGERTIAYSLWDATSPHWNFCRPLMLQQLARPEANALISEPLEALGIRISDRPSFLAGAWGTSDGHPELLQYLGDKLVSLVNERDRKDIHVSAEDIANITSQYDFGEQYLETYWGQATPLERVLSILLLEGMQSVEALAGRVQMLTGSIDSAGVQSALRMLELYGIATQSSAGYKLRLSWFSSALSAYGGPDTAMSRYLGRIAT